MKTEAAALTHQGRRANNEDAFCSESELGLFAVADGVGGYEGGEVASRLAIDTLVGFFRRNAQDPEATWPYRLERHLTFVENMLHVAARLAHQAICTRKEGVLASMGSTLAAVTVHKGEAVLGHVGDSRVYRLRTGHLEQLTRDHSLYEQMRASGGVEGPKSEFPFRNVITRALGMPGDATLELRREQLMPGDVFLICSDGLSEPVGEAEIAAALESSTVQASCEHLVRRAYDAGGRDNITAVVVRVS